MLRSVLSWVSSPADDAFISHGLDEEDLSGSGLESWEGLILRAAFAFVASGRTHLEVVWGGSMGVLGRPRAGLAGPGKLRRAK